MITKPKDSKDVHELCISKEEFEAKGKGQLESKCARQKGEVQGILQTNELAMTQLVRDRMAVLYAIEKGSQEESRFAKEWTQLTE